ncbi:STN domain-containing protein, partial [Phocaeicola paurosaccharolyticus]
MKVNLKTRRLLTIALLLGGITASGWAQDVSLNFKQKKLETVLSAIKSQTGYSLAYSDEYVNVNQKVSIEVQKKPLEQALHALF